MLPFAWAGFTYSLYAGNEGTMNSYSHMTLFFSMLNANVLIEGEKLSNKVLNVLADANCVPFFVWTLANIVHLLVKQRETVRCAECPKGACPLWDISSGPTPRGAARSPASG